MGTGQSGAANGLTLGVQTTGADKIIVSSVVGTPSSGLSSGVTTVNTGTWYHACGVFTSDTSRDAFLNGGEKGSDTGSRSPSSPDQFRIGARSYQAAANYFDGSIAEAGIWNVALSDEEVAQLGLGYSPLMIRPSALVGYWPMLGNNSPELDRKGSTSFTWTNSPTKADHCRVILPSRPR